MGPMQRMGHPGGRMPGPMNPYDSLQNYSMGPRGPPPNTNMGPGPGGMPPMSMSVQSLIFSLLNGITFRFFSLSLIFSLFDGITFRFFQKLP